jgi:hypothetical protein
MKLTINKNINDTIKLQTSYDMNSEVDNITNTENSFVSTLRTNLCKEIYDDDENNIRQLNDELLSPFYNNNNDTENRSGVRCMNIYHYKKMKCKRIN